MPAVIIAYRDEGLTTPEKRPAACLSRRGLSPLLCPSAQSAHDGGGHCYRKPYPLRPQSLRGVGVYPHRARDEAPEGAENWRSAVERAKPTSAMTSPTKAAAESMEDEIRSEDDEEYIPAAETGDAHAFFSSPRIRRIEPADARALILEAEGERHQRQHEAFVTEQIGGKPRRAS